jgi:hypothetical protein
MFTVQEQKLQLLVTVQYLIQANMKMGKVMTLLKILDIHWAVAVKNK